VSRLSAPSVSGGGGVNINIMDVAWSMPQSYVVDDEVESPTNNADTWPRDVGDNVTASVPPPHDSYLGLISQPDTEHQHPSYQPEHHYPSFIRRRFMSVEDYSEVSSNIVDDNSVIAVAGSNGVIVAWNASSLLSAQSSNSNSRNNMASPHQRATSATFGQREASFLAHSRAVNRLAWHPTGRRPYLLLTASQDGSVKLWDRRASSSLSVHAESISSIGSNLSLAQPMTKNWFGFGGFGASSSQAVQNVQLPPQLSEPSRTATWHCISTYQPKCEAVRDICWNPLMDDGELLVP
jgi:WD40 repeat protein